jgi:hypothetical protein
MTLFVNPRATRPLDADSTAASFERLYAETLAARGRRAARTT